MKKNILRGIIIVLLLGIFYMIFNFSSQDGEESSGVSQKVTVAITKNVKKIQSLEEQQKQQVLEQTEKIVRKLAHFSIYTLVGLLLMALMNTYDIKERNRVIISLIIGIAYASSDEIHQIFTPGRSAMITDVMIDTMGVFLGIILMMLVIKLWKKLLTKNTMNFVEN